MHLHQIHFYVEAATRWRDCFLQTLGAKLVESQPAQEDTLTHHLQWGAIALQISSPQSCRSPVAQFLERRSPGIGAIAVAVPDISIISQRVAQHGGKFVPGEPTVVISPWGFRHILSPQSPTSRQLSTAAPLPQVDHLVMNVPQGQLEATVQWYAQVFGMERQQAFVIETGQSGLRSQVLTHPVSGFTLPINEPTSPTSQIQEFLDHHGGAGIQHLAIRLSRLIPMIQRLRQTGLDFLEVPEQYYLNQNAHFWQQYLSQAEWTAVRSQHILIDQPTTGGLLLQIFSQPIFDQPTFFWEFIERRHQAQGFGEGNFLALFRAIEQAQAQRIPRVLQQ